MKIAVLFFCLLFVSCSSSNQSQTTCEETRKLLSEPRISNENFVCLFQIGDERVDDLITALTDKDKNVRSNAQTMIRYIDNPKATKAMYEWLSENALQEKGGFPTSPIPIPINDWEYEFEEKSYKYSSPSSLKDSYALFFDDSDKAKATLQKFIEQENNNQYGLGKGAKLERLRELKIGQPFQENGDLCRAVLQTPLFQFETYDPHKKTATEKLKAKIINYNATKTKAVMEVQNDDGIFEVIIEKVSDGWKFYSVTQSAVF